MCLIRFVIFFILLTGCKISQQSSSNLSAEPQKQDADFTKFKNSFEKADFHTCSKKRHEYVTDQLCVSDKTVKLDIIAILATYADKLVETNHCNKSSGDTCEMTLGHIAESFKNDPNAHLTYKQFKAESLSDTRQQLSLISNIDNRNEKIICKSSYFAELQIKELICKLTEAKEDAKLNCGSICAIDSSGRPMNCLCALKFNPRMRRFINVGEEECKASEPLPGGFAFKWYSKSNSLPLSASERCSFKDQSRCWGCFLE